MAELDPSQLTKGIHDGHRANMRHRYLASGLDGFQDHEVLELLLFYVFPRTNTNPVAHELISSCGSLQAVLNAPPEELTNIKGFGTWGALLFNLLPRLMVLSAAPDEQVYFSSREEAVGYMTRLLQEKQEYNCQMYIGSDHRLLMLRFSENLAPPLRNVQEVLLNALTSGAVSVVLGCRVPADQCALPEADYFYVKQLKTALDFVNVKLWDYCLVSDERLVSFQETGCLSSAH